MPWREAVGRFLWGSGGGKSENVSSTVEDQIRSVEFSGPLQVSWSGEPSQGQRGLFASRNVQAGELLMVACPLVWSDSGDVPWLTDALLAAYERSPELHDRLACLADNCGNSASPQEAALAFGCLSGKPQPDASLQRVSSKQLKVPGIVTTNTIPCGRGDAVFGLPSLMNHSCDGREANVCKMPSADGGTALIFKASRNISSGEELCHRYFEVDVPLSERRSRSARLGFVCQCSRCCFEEKLLPGTAAGKAVETAVQTFEKQQRAEMRGFWSAAQGNDSQPPASVQTAGNDSQPPASVQTAGNDSQPPASVQTAARRWSLLRELVDAVKSVEEAATFHDGWGDEEVGWCLSLVQPLSNAALWLLVTHVPARDGAGEECGDLLTLRCQVLSRIVAAWAHTQSFGLDHMRNMQLLWSALDEARVRAIGKAAVQVAPRPASTGEGQQNEEGRDTPPCPRMQSAQFFEAVRKQGLRAMLEESGGIVQVTDLLPAGDAVEARAVLERLAEDEWAFSGHASAVNADHRFWRYEGNQVDFVKKTLAGLIPEMHPKIYAARYDTGGRITLHNDAMQWTVQPDEVVNEERFGAGEKVYRKVALIYYLTKDWREEYGGCLVDNLWAGPRTIVPQFNSLVAFLVPREHWVTEVAPGAPLRYTIFGWLHDSLPYPAGSPPPLGSGNADAGSAARTHMTPAQVAPALKTKEVCDAVREASDVRYRLEEAFRVRFGVSAKDLRLGETGSRAGALLRNLQNAPP